VGGCGWIGTISFEGAGQESMRSYKAKVAILV
jgi:hypothetical protein